MPLKAQVSICLIIIGKIISDYLLLRYVRVFFTEIVKCYYRERINNFIKNNNLLVLLVCVKYLKTTILKDSKLVREPHDSYS